MEDRIQGLSVSEVQADEIWGFVGMKQKTKNYQGREDDDLVLHNAAFRELEHLRIWRTHIATSEYD